MAKNGNDHIHRVVIDAGHGGQDPGALGLHSREKDIVLSVALKIGKLIKEKLPDVEVIYTRSSDVFIPLHERANIANKNKADLFISIHANANPNKSVFGAETYVMGLHTNEKNMEVAKKENAAIVYENDYTSHYEGYDPNSAESFIIFSLMQYTFTEQSLSFASMVQKNFRQQANRQDRGVRQAGFLVLWKTTMPSLLIELGFISNPEEERYLMSEKGQNQLAMSVFDSFFEYKTKIEEKSRQKGEKKQEEKTETRGEKKSVAKSEPIHDSITVRDEEAEADSTRVVFRIQVGTSNKPLAQNKDFERKAQKVNPDKSVFERKVGVSWYKFYIGSFTQYPDAQKCLSKAKRVFPDAFVVPFKNSEIISLKEAIQ
jgi:N-acetylmuramoyl-L-alanine amidase